jgi:Reverse transcriptase (RNA-dependent DNA polymerase)
MILTIRLSTATITSRNCGISFPKRCCMHIAAGVAKVAARRGMQLCFRRKQRRCGLMTTLNEAHRVSNLKRAWRWVKSNPDAGYKNYCGHAYSRYALADAALLDELRDELERGIYEPTNATKLLLPKKSGILRPYTILTVSDQIVYQAMVNVIAERLAPRVRSHYLRVSYGHMYAGKRSTWFYKPWRQGYSAFNEAARNAFRRGLKFGASFDLTACYDSLDYSVLVHFLRELNCDREFCEKLREYLGFWTANNSLIYHSHGIPQGPLSSGLLSEVVLRHFDLNYGPRSNVRYLRYVDDIRLFASREDALRRMLIRLDTLSKDVGLFPQASKINIHKIEDIEEELKSVSAPYGPSPEDDDEDEDETRSQRDIRTKIISITPRFTVENETRFKFLLSRADPSSKLNTRLLRITHSRPDLIPQVMRHLRKYDALPKRVAEDLIERLRKEPLYENTTAEIVLTLDERTPSGFSRGAVAAMRRLWRRRALTPELRVAIGRAFFRDGRISESSIRYFLRSINDWWVRAELFNVLTPARFGTIFLVNVLNDGIRDKIGDPSLSASERLARIGLGVTRPLNDLNVAAARALRQLGVISRLPKGVDGIERSMTRLLGKPTGVNWRRIFPRNYKHAEKQAVFCRALAETDPTAFVNAADVFNDLLLDRLYRHDLSLGAYVLGNVGSILGSARLRRKYPAIFAFVSETHEKRYISNLSHAVARRTGKPTGRIRFKYMRAARRLMRSAVDELALAW